MIRRGLELVFKSWIFILILSFNRNILGLVQISVIETLFLLILYFYGFILNKLLKGRVYRYNVAVFSFFLAAVFFYLSESFGFHGNESSSFLPLLFLNYFVVLEVKDGIKEVAEVSLAFTSVAVLTFAIRMIFLNLREPVLFFILPPGIILSFAIAVAVLRKRKEVKG